MVHAAHRGSSVARARAPKVLAGPRRSARCLLLLAGAAPILLAPTLALADPVEWALENSGNWFDPTRWTPNATVNNNNPPGTLYDAFIGQGLLNTNPFTVTLDAPATIQSLTLEQEVVQTAGFVTLDLNANILTLNTDLTITDASVVDLLAGASSLSVAGNVSLTRAFFMWTRLDTAPGSIITFGGGAGDSTIICDTDVGHRGMCLIDGGEELVIMGDSAFTAEAGSTIDLRSPAGLITGSPGGGGTPELIIQGTLLQNTPGASTTINALDFQNTGTLDVSEGTLSTDGVTLVGGVLDAGTWRVSNGATLDLAGTTITTNAATVELDGAATSFAALDSLDTNDAAGTLRLTGGADFTTAADFTNDGLLEVGFATEFTVDPGSTLTNFTAGTLSGGEFNVSGTLRFDNADITDLDGAITINGPLASIEDQLGQDALRNLDTIAADGDLTLLGRSFTTAGDLTVATTGRLGVGTGAVFSVPTGNTITNFVGGTFTGGVFDVEGTLVVDAAVEALDGDFTLDGPVSNIIRPGGGDVFETLSLIDTNGALALRNGRTLSVLGNVTVNGRLTVESGPPDAPSIFIVPGDVTQTAGVAELREGGIVRVGGGNGFYNLTGGLITGVGRIEGNLIQTGGTVAPGNSAGQLDIDGDWLLNPASTVEIELGGTVPGMADFIDVTGVLAIGSPSTPVATLVLDLINGYVPSPAGDTFEIIRGSQRLGQFANVNGPMVGGNPAFTVFYTTTSVWVTVYAVPTPASVAVLAMAGLAATKRRRAR